MSILCLLHYMCLNIEVLIVYVNVRLQFKHPHIDYNLMRMHDSSLCVGNTFSVDFILSEVYDFDQLGLKI